MTTAYDTTDTLALTDALSHCPQQTAQAPSSVYEVDAEEVEDKAAEYVIGKCSRRAPVSNAVGGGNLARCSLIPLWRYRRKLALVGLG